MSVLGSRTVVAGPICITPGCPWGHRGVPGQGHQALMGGAGASHTGDNFFPLEYSEQTSFYGVFFILSFFFFPKPCWFHLPFLKSTNLL